MSAERRHEMLIPFRSSVQSILPLSVMIKQGYVQLWLTAFDEIAAANLGTSAIENDSLYQTGLTKCFDSVVGLKLLVNVVKTVNGLTHFVFAKIDPARTKLPDDILDSTNRTVR